MTPIHQYVFLHKFIFTKIYKFYQNVFKEKDAWLFAAIIFTGVWTNIIVIIPLFYRYIELPYKTNIYDDYYSYATVAVALFMLYYVHKDNRYIRIVEECDSISPKSVRRWKIISWIYVIAIFTAYYWLGSKIREIY